MLTIKDVWALQPESPGCPPDWRSSLGQILVVVETSAGLTGYGVGGGGAAGLHVVRTVLRDLLLGQDAEDIEGLWAKMYRATLPFGRKGLAIMALSGIDLALWDLRGKAAGLPIVALLGGKPGIPIPMYATLFGPLDEALAAGFHAVKVHFHGHGTSGPASSEAMTRLVAETRARIGPDRTLMVDAFMKWDVPLTLRLASEWSAFQLAWIEEPLSPDDLAGYAQLAGACPVPIAGGEHEFTAAAFAELIERRLHQVLQPDVCWCGGLTQLIAIYKHAKAAGLRVCPHRGAEPWALHAIAALDREPLAESGRPWMTWVENGPQIERGFATLSDRPGFGVSFSMT